ncbi:hypothetical protein COO91_02355 [Nostoc flagelliforme CCNUN1]|uniref:Uncharacterized protein n=1 Tax=Nostoc flagelliforme CCNUN1 TaxID=2038116 RepID=A0A2K8SMB3_9NOSO|nr:hypothetical protein COO91_02355 [Nostoc flagelliforme CCNUN1]
MIDANRDRPVICHPAICQLLFAGLKIAVGFAKKTKLTDVL